MEGTVLGPRFLNRLLNMLTGDMGVGHNFSKTRHGANENWDLRIKKLYLPKTCLSLPLYTYIYMYNIMYIYMCINIYIYIYIYRYTHDKYVNVHV